MNKAAQALGKLRGESRLRFGGKQVFKDMAKKSWEQPSMKRAAMQIIRAATSSVAAAQRRSLRGTKPNCSVCQKEIMVTKLDAHFHHTDYNKPFVLQVLCNTCHQNWHKKFKAIKITQENAEKIFRENNKSIQCSYEVIADALGYKRRGCAIDYYGVSE